MQNTPANSGPNLDTNQEVICWRITNIPDAYTKERLKTCLQDFDQSLKEKFLDISLYPGNYCDGTQTALVKIRGCPESFLQLGEDGYIGIPDASCGEILDLQIDNHFYNLTPLNNPEGEDIIDVIAVTGLGKNAFRSWRNRSSDKMWLQDFLPKHIKNIRVLTYGYNTNLVGKTVDDKLLDYRGHLLEQLDNARGSAAAKRRPIIFIGHDFGGILILQALLHSKNRRHYKHILDSTKTLFFFGVPHNGIRTDDLEAMVRELKGPDSSRLKLLENLQRNSDVLSNQRSELLDIWTELSVYSFYEKSKTPTVVKTDSGRFERKGQEEVLVDRSSAGLFVPSERQIGVAKDHTDMIKFHLPVDPTYATLRRFMHQEVDKIVKLLSAWYPNIQI